MKAQIEVLVYQCIDKKCGHTEIILNAEIKRYCPKCSCIMKLINKMQGEIKFNEIDR